MGLGAGKRKYECPGLLRAMIIEYEESYQADTVTLLETNIDDSTGEELGFVMEKLFEEKALDVFYQPIYMKKNRPAYLLSVLCHEKDRETLEKTIFRHTTTIGIRRSQWQRTTLSRRNMTVETPLGSAEVKICGDRIYPEYESVKTICEAHGISFREAWQMIQASAKAAM